MVFGPQNPIIWALGHLGSATSSKEVSRPRGRNHCCTQTLERMVQQVTRSIACKDKDMEAMNIKATVSVSIGLIRGPVTVDVVFFLFW